ncbi:hypothetical protein [Caulobacter hibisci]|uniref:Uncharacterized protein n=1 Tax=Caulobacter hibisci TaxID=2035993 RepID=A0ABS0SXR6_9CAUL|nr:hypothetical protein [Caulobacter hibisci]MBI1684437.1 hypothetical protein [Caulobacter hibisci]
MTQLIQQHPVLAFVAFAVVAGAIYQASSALADFLEACAEERRAFAAMHAANVEAIEAEVERDTDRHRRNYPEA